MNRKERTWTQREVTAVFQECTPTLLPLISENDITPSILDHYVFHFPRSPCPRSFLPVQVDPKRRLERNQIFMVGCVSHLCLLACHSTYIFKYSSTCLLKLGSLTLGTYKLTIVVSSWCIASFISMNWPSLSLLTNLGLMSILSKYCYSYLFSGAISLVNLFLPFHPKPMLISVCKLGFF
jgi:hypothetical protein